jgi:hypothetical protein
MHSFYALQAMNAKNFKQAIYSTWNFAHNFINYKKAHIYFRRGSTATKCNPVIEKLISKLNLYSHFRLAIQYLNLVMEMEH